MGCRDEVIQESIQKYFTSCSLIKHVQKRKGLGKCRDGGTKGGGGGHRIEGYEMDGVYHVPGVIMMDWGVSCTGCIVDGCKKDGLGCIMYRV